MSVKEFFAEVNPDMLETALVAGLTKHGSYFTARHRDMDLKTLCALKNMINQDIKQMKEEINDKIDPAPKSAGVNKK